MTRRENTRSPRYRLLAAVAARPAPPAVPPSESFERDCPGCGRVVLFTQRGGTYEIEDHDCG